MIVNYLSKNKRDAVSKKLRLNTEQRADMKNTVQMSDAPRRNAISTTADNQKIYYYLIPVLA